MAPTKAVKLVDGPLRTALSQRNREGRPVVRGELTGHPDAGSQYTPITLTDEGIPPSTGSLADAYDNALTERVTGLCKTECIGTTVFPASPYRTIGDVEYATAGQADRNNNKRLHNTLKTMTPMELEQAHHPTHNPEPQPVQERRRT